MAPSGFVLTRAFRNRGRDFGQERMNCQFIHLPIVSCDFSLEQYEASSLREFGDSFVERMKKPWPMQDDAEKTAEKTETDRWPGALRPRCCFAAPRKN